MSTNLYTIGYEGLSLQEFIQILQNHHIQTVIDVRELPLSRKPGFSKTKLSQALEDAGIQYQSIRALGSPRPLRHELRETNDWKAFSSRFSIYLQGKTDVLMELVEHAYEETICLLCFEKDCATCHRSIVAKKAVEIANNGLRACHL